MNRRGGETDMLVAAAIIGLLALGTSPARAQLCSGVHHIDWPAGAPVWSFCWVPPDASAGPGGSGLEIHHAFYRGKRVFWRASVPVLNVNYDPGSGWCGPTYRDWLNTLQAFDAGNVLAPGYAEPTSTPRTVCDAPGADIGTFAGVAVEKRADRIVLWTQTAAGWYRYIQRIAFLADGTIEPGFGFTAVEHECINDAHTHYGYWRFDFDIDGAANDRIVERNRLLWFWWPTSLSVETTRLRLAKRPRRWRVLDRDSGRGYEIIPGSLDGPGGDPFGGPDLWAIRYHSTETDDGGSTSGPAADAQHIDPFVNGESIASGDVVLWYRISHRHMHGPSCALVGPRLVAIGPW